MNDLKVMSDTPFDLSFVYGAPCYDILQEYLKKAKAFKKLEGLSKEAHRAAVKAAVAEILILIRMIKEFPEESRKKLSSADKGAAKYFSEFTPEQIEEIIESYGLLTPAGLKVSVENAKAEREKHRRYQEFKQRVYTEDEEFSQRIKNEVREEIENEVMHEKLHEWRQVDATKIRMILESSDPKLSERLTEIVKEEIREELSETTEKLAEQYEQDKRAELSEIMARPQDGIESVLKELRTKAESDLELFGYVPLGDMAREYLRGSSLNTNEVVCIVIDNLSRYLRRKYDLVLSLSPKEKGNSVYIKLDCATHAQIRDDVENKAASIMADLGKFNRYYRQYTGSSSIVHSLHSLTKDICSDEQQGKPFLSA